MLMNIHARNEHVACSRVSNSIRMMKLAAMIGFPADRRQLKRTVRQSATQNHESQHTLVSLGRDKAKLAIVSSR